MATLPPAVPGATAIAGALPIRYSRARRSESPSGGARSTAGCWRWCWS